MPLPWDDANVRPNLLVIASLRVDDKLSVLKRGANPGVADFTNIGLGGRSLRAIFARQKGGFWFKKHQRKERAKKGEDVLNDLQYFIPLTSIFRRAKELWLASQQEIELTHIRNAYAGLLNLQKTYMDEEDEERFQKMVFINQAIASLIPEEYERYNCIIIQEGTQTLNLFNYTKVLPNLQRALVGFLDLNNNNYASVEQGLGSPPQTTLTVTQLVIDNVINAVPLMFRHTAATTLPTLTAPYTRTGLGICRQFPADLLRSPPIVDGTPMARNLNALKGLFIALGGDEGMFFLVSQLACQVGLEAIPQTLLTYRNKQAENTMAHNWVLFYKDKFWTPMQVSSRNIYIDTQLRIIEMKLVMDFSGLYFYADSKEDQPNCNLDPYMTIPLTSKMTLIAKLERKGNRIDINFSKAELEVVGN